MFKKDKNMAPEVPAIAPKMSMPSPQVPEMPQMPTVNESMGMPSPFGQESMKPISKEINPNTPNRDEPFFVRIDKFNQARDNFEDISRKLNELERLMTKMDELKVKENQEIDEFKKATADIKQTLTDVDKEIFSKL